MKAMFFAAVMLASVPAWAGGTGGDLYAACASAPGSTGDTICDSYINGLANGVLVDQIAKEQGTPICLPDHTDTGRVRQGIKKFIEDHPLTKSFESGTVAGTALIALYPCKKSN